MGPTFVCAHAHRCRLGDGAGVPRGHASACVRGVPPAELWPGARGPGPPSAALRPPRCRQGRWLDSWGTDLPRPAQSTSRDFSGSSPSERTNRVLATPNRTRQPNWTKGIGRLATGFATLRESLPDLRVVGGCCGTDIRHVGAISDALNEPKPHRGAFGGAGDPAIGAMCVEASPGLGVDARLRQPCRQDGEAPQPRGKAAGRGCDDGFSTSNSHTRSHGQRRVIRQSVRRCHGPTPTRFWGDHAGCRCPPWTRWSVLGCRDT
jgi:hypothetical protein